MRSAALLATLAALQTAACREEAVTRSRAPKAEMEAVGAMGMPAQGLRWTLPSGWKEVPGNGMRLATLVQPGGLKTQAIVVALPGDSGGELANVNRWRGQIGLPATDEAGAAASRTTINTKAGPATIYDFAGAGSTPARAIIAAVDAGGTTWFFKLMGDAAATEAARGDFLALIKGLTPDAPR